jgi:hypothetical protein
VEFLDFFCGFLFGCGASALFLWLAERRALSIVKKRAADKAVNVKQDDENEFAVALAECYQIWKEPSLDNNAKLEAALGVALRHPRVAGRLAKMAKKILTNKGGDVGGLLAA